MKSITRRGLLAAGVAGAAGAVAGPARAAGPMPEKWDETFDVVVVGSGFAGLAAAIEAHAAGASVVVLEKMPLPGGNSKINGGIVSVPGNAPQKALGIEDSAARLAEDILREGQGYNYPDKVKLMAERAYATWEWTVRLGVKYRDAVGQEGGHSVPRHLTTVEGLGSGIVMRELDWLKARKVPVRLQCYVETIIRDADGRVKGLRVREGYKFPDAASGTVRHIKAARGVVLCYGGFGADVKFRMKYDPKLNEKFDTTNQPGATSELWRETARIGCSQIQQDWIQCGPWNSPEERGMGIALYFAQGAAATRGMWIDCGTGKRFVNELANRKVRADAVIARNNQGHRCIALADSVATGTLEQNRPGLVARQLAAGVVHTAGTLEELAKTLSIPLDALKKSVADYNAALAKGSGDEVGRPFYPKAQPMAKGPWYYSFLSPKVHHCMGGLETTLDCEVVGIVDDRPIPGLYAAGEATGGIHGAVRLGSCATLDCLVNGRIAGRKAALAKPW